MIGRSFDWLDSRTSYRKLLAPIRRRILPGGPSWTRTTGSCLLWLLLVEVVTGLLLMFTYSPSASSAWASVHYIESIPGGDFIRGLHYFTSQALLIALALHTIRTLVAGAFRAPRELIWATGLLLIPIVLTWAITGNPLPGSEKSYAQIEVESKIIGSSPVVGPVLQRILIGGDRVGNLTLTHLNFLHVALLPLIAGVVLAIHISQIYVHGLPQDGVIPISGRSRPYFPYQTIRNLTVFSVVLAVIGFLSWNNGAPLDAPAGAGEGPAPRPEWYFLFLFELRGYFTGDFEFIATAVIPGVVLALLLAIPLIDYVLPSKVSRAFRYALAAFGIAAWAGLTWVSVSRDRNDPEYQQTKLEAQKTSARARELADANLIPPGGASLLIELDPKTQGPRLFEQQCALCHRHDGVIVEVDPHNGEVQPASAPNLTGFASRKWLAGFLDPDQIDSPKYFGSCKFGDPDEGQMVSAQKDIFADLDEEELAEVRRKRDLIVLALSAEAQLPAQAEADKQDADQIAEGVALLNDGELGCTDCHMFHDSGEPGMAPDLTSYGSKAWMTSFICNPSDDRFYGENNDRMPSFAPGGGEPAILSPNELSVLIDWLRGDWYEPGDTATSPQAAAE